ncbi:cytochrome c-type biogenesis protein CcmH [Rhodoblastus sp. 17X3]|uniref:cytochrome c-type biogenesis protein n=1 Tax=Rhodoblastus sp. 17X3 TaxID=3047026 RepID=UPI0024B82503|nr:cytochrome c-type biogenesis protein [Rhodoblastus sp. 17X3]MDI9849089.1 cytochrome c-type biogenesis protein CcmH [Rhodoblastus sp. 17X3]
MKARLFAFFTLLALSAPAFAVQPDEILPDAKLEQRARNISANLRCLVCQNQSIDDSDASLAKDLRLLVRERLKAGDSDPQVKEFLVARYGNFILLKPPFEWDTLLLWLSPFAILGLGAAAVFAARRKGQDAQGDKAVAPLSEEESARLKSLLGQSPDEGQA